MHIDDFLKRDPESFIFKRKKKAPLQPPKKKERCETMKSKKEIEKRLHIIENTPMPNWEKQGILIDGGVIGYTNALKWALGIEK